jgi:hypothetical protein
MIDYLKISYYLSNLPHFDFDDIVVLQRPTTSNQLCPLLDTIIVKKEDEKFFINLLNNASIGDNFTVGNHPGFVLDEIFGETPIVCGYDHKSAFKTLINTLTTLNIKGLEDAIA